MVHEVRHVDHEPPHEHREHEAARVSVTAAHTVITVSARFSQPTSRTRCSLYGPSTDTQFRPRPGKSS